MAEKPIGEVIHYYGKLGVAIVKLKAGLKNGETVRFERGEESFEQAISSMQVDHEEIAKAKKGAEVGIKVDSPAKEGTLVYKAKG